MKNLRSPALWLMAVLVLATAACSAAVREGATNSDVITHEEIEASMVQNAYELVQQLRPRWLRSRGSRSLTMATQTLVYMNDSRLGGIDALRNISTGGIQSIQYLDAARAIAELPGLGSQHTEGVIVIRTY